jgi:hypothetical protein
VNTSTLERTPLQDLADVLLGEDVVAYVAGRRVAGVKWADVVAELAEKTGGRVHVTDRQLRTWLYDGGYATDGTRAQPKAPSAPAAPEDPVDAEIRGVTEWVAEQRAMAASR